jgi:hypothetical protein
MIAPVCNCAFTKTNEMPGMIALPEKAGQWQRPAEPRLITGDTIFEYMDGAGELYLGYRFDRLLVYEYTAPDQYDILVEIYHLKTADDAFGLLSLDWGGEVFPMASDNNPDTIGFVPPARALYGAGLLRLWAGPIYARIMAYRETSESRDAVLQIGAVIARQIDAAGAPILLKRLPESIVPGCRLPREQMSFFRSYLVLNSIYYLSEENILDLDLNCSAATAVCQMTGQPRQPRLLLIEYPAASQAAAALDHFLSAYLPEAGPKSAEMPGAGRIAVHEIEEGWCGYRDYGTFLAIIFAAPDRENATKLLFNLNLH